MLNRIIRASRDFTGSTSLQPTSLAVFVRDTASGFMTSVHHTFMILGVAAIGALALMFVRPDVTDHLKALSPFTMASAEEAVDPALAANAMTNLVDVPSPSPSDIIEARRYKLAKASTHAIYDDAPDRAMSAATRRQQALVTNWLAKKYRVASDASDMLVSAAYVTAKEIKLDPLLILSVMAIESGLNPFAESPVGAQGLMQVMSKVHHEKFQQLGGIKAALNPVANIKVGSLILKDYVTRGGSVEAGLKLYVGAAAFETDFGYGYKVLAEYRRLKDVARGKTVSVTSNSNSYVAKTKPAERAPEAPAAATSEDSKKAPTDPVASIPRIIAML